MFLNQYRLSYTIAIVHFVLFICVYSAESDSTTLSISYIETADSARGSLFWQKRTGYTLSLRYVGSYFKDFKDVLLYPRHWGAPEFIKAGGVTAAALLLYKFDKEIIEFAQKQRTLHRNKIAKAVKLAGEGELGTAMLGTYFLYGYIFNDYRARRCALLGLKSFSIAAIFTEILKHLGHRKRPSASDDPYVWSGPSLYKWRKSFPSGHATAAFSICTAIAESYEGNLPLGISLYTLATLSALSRVYDNRHWASDVLVGAAIGYATAKAVIALDKKRNSTVLIFPTIDNNTTTINTRIVFTITN